MKHLLILIVSLIAVATIVDAWCGTTNPYGHGKSRSGEETCVKTDCDTEQGRAPYYYTQGSSPIYSFTVNSILFGDYYNNTDLNKRYNDSLATLKTKYLSALGMDLTIKSTIVTDEYQVVDEDNVTLHQQMATKYYKKDEMTLMFSKILGRLYGYANVPWRIDTNNIAGSYYTLISTSKAALGGANTTVLHEIGHMLGLLHVFNEDDYCGDCTERPNSPDRNSVGDFCNDTLPMRNEGTCDGSVLFDKNCFGDYFTSLDKLPTNNYMAYTADSCQTLGFTPQQVARARCYLATKLTFLVTATTPAAGTPAAGTPVGTPSKSNTPFKTSDATVASSVAAVVVGVIAMAL